VQEQSINSPPLLPEQKTYHACPKWADYDKADVALFLEAHKCNPDKLVLSGVPYFHWQAIPPDTYKG
jgi:hypothetical protein